MATPAGTGHRPLSLGVVARFQRFDWDTGELAEWIELPPRPETVVIEGVSAMRSEFDPYLAYRIWVAAPGAVRLRRGLERDGEHMRAQWERWMAGEEAYAAADRAVDRADAVRSGIKRLTRFGPEQPR